MANGDKSKNIDTSKWDDQVTQYLESPENKDKNFVKRIFNAKDKNHLSLDMGNGDEATHLMSWGSDDKGNFIFPNVVQKPGENKLTHFKTSKEAIDYAKQSGEYVRVGRDNDFAEYISSAGYKKYFPEDVYNEAKEKYQKSTGIKLNAMPETTNDEKLKKAQIEAAKPNDPKWQVDPHGNNLMRIDSDNEDYSKIKYINHGYKEGVKTNEHGLQKTIVRPPSTNVEFQPKQLIKVSMTPDLDNKYTDENGKTVFKDPQGIKYLAHYHDGSTQPISEADYYQLHNGFNKADPLTKEKMNQEFFKAQQDQYQKSLS